MGPPLDGVVQRGVPKYGPLADRLGSALHQVLQKYQRQFGGTLPGRDEVDRIVSAVFVIVGSSVVVVIVVFFILVLVARRFDDRVGPLLHEGGG